MSTSTQIRIDAQLLSGFQINEVTSFTWVKDATRNIVREHPLAAPKKTEIVNIENAPETYCIDEELVRLEKITLKDSKRSIVVKKEYECDELGNIIFYNPGEYEITYRYVPADVTNLTDNLPIPDRYAECIKYYVAARITGRIKGVDNAEAQNYDNLFWQHINDADISMVRTNKRFRRLPPR